MLFFPEYIILSYCITQQDASYQKYKQYYMNFEAGHVWTMCQQIVYEKDAHQNCYFQRHIITVSDHVVQQFIEKVINLEISTKERKCSIQYEIIMGKND